MRTIHARRVMKDKNIERLEYELAEQSRVLGARNTNIGELRRRQEILFDAVHQLTRQEVSDVAALLASLSS